jgi:phosphopantetheinyl transferase
MTVRPAQIDVVLGTIAALAADPDPGAYRAILSDDEMARAGRLSLAEPRARFIAGRVLLRRALAAFAAADPATLRLALTPAGRPELPDRPELSFSLSHGRRLAAVAMSFDARVGVDLEETGRQVDMAGVASTAFTVHERTLLSGAAEPLAAFLAIWTAKEAVAKATGHGFRVEPHRQGLTGGLPEPGGPARPASDHEGRRWWVRAVALSEAAATCAVASDRADTRLAVTTIAGA